MKKHFLSSIILVLCLPGMAQLSTSDGAYWVNNGNVTVTIQNLDFVNDGNFIAGTGSMKFTGNQNSEIKGAKPPLFNILELSKTNGSKVLLSRSISVGSSISFISGQLDLGFYSVLLSPAGYLAGESENNRVIGSNGFIEITQDLNAPVSANPGNLGATITSSANLGTVTIKRGHSALSGIGLPGGIHRYYSISPQTNAGLDATLRLKYFDAELNGQNENALVIYQSFTAAGGWLNLSKTSSNTNANYVEKTGVTSLALQTLANDNVQLTDGASGLVFTGQRKKATEVALKWTSQTESNISGYQLQRRLKNEADFTDRTFVNSSAAGGNSLSPLSYQHIDDNSYPDTSFYRLKIITTNNAFSYSDVIAVAAKTKGGGSGNGNGNNRDAGDDMTSFNGKPSLNPTSKKITVGPNPNNGNFWFSVNGIEKETIATLSYIDGKQIRRFKVANLQKQHVTGLKSGLYILQIPGFESQKIIVNSQGNFPVNNTQSKNDNSKL